MKSPCDFYTIKENEWLNRFGFLAIGTAEILGQSNSQFKKK
jgi:hypothetical protein